MTNKKAQGWGIDLTIALTLFTISIILFYFYSINFLKEPDTNFKHLKEDAEFVLDSILSEGYPYNWTEDDVVNIGILSNNRINQSKLEKFYNLTVLDYSRTKNLFETSYDYFFSIENENISLSDKEITGIGKPNTTINEINTTDLIKVKRISIYQDKPTTVYLYMWK